MKRRVFALLLALCLTLTVMPMSASAANLQPAVTDNHWAHDYKFNWAQPIQSYLFENDFGGVTRVEYVKTADQYTFDFDKDEWYDGPEQGYIIVEEYDDRFQLVNKVDIPKELSKWGGFFAGEDYNFFIFAENNPAESFNDDYMNETFRVVKYSKDWKRLDMMQGYGWGYKPVEAGSLRCAEYGGMLYIRTCYQMLKQGGAHHQANLMAAVRQSDMKCTQVFGGVVGGEYGYVSHSFNQFIMVTSEGQIVTVDQGDAYPERGALLSEYIPPAGSEIFTDYENTWYSIYQVNMRKAEGSKGENETGMEIGGLAETKNGYLVAYTYNDRNDDISPAYLGYVTKDSIGLKKEPQITTRTISDGFCANPVLVPTGLDGGYVLWEEVEYYFDSIWGEMMGLYSQRRTFYYARYYGDGTLGPTQKADGVLSDCQPIIYNGEVLWYTTNNSTPTFYILGENGLRAVFKDVPGDAYYYDAVEWAVKNEITSGTDISHFSPNTGCTRAQAVTFLWRAAGKPEPQSGSLKFTDVKSGSYYEKAVRWAVEQGITSGTSTTKFSPDAKCTRAQIVTFLWRAAGSPSADGDSFSDVSGSSYYSKAVSWAVKSNITSGTGNGKFSPDQSCTRAQIVSFLYRAA